ncbi:nSTAND1 domain-containing NTPase [Portibacter lacus]|uniref:Novel STAND NTPase 1 domain-containing protein n=1 Tax=Portibacter lacus TaxID=1099794 RepID=A0AA37SLR7_9BACT|nr:hypothetical protein [Portibacter lacus]GLR16681.1 hypothetical protein GCM10007940_12960 [Portibacter lacus]
MLKIKNPYPGFHDGIHRAYDVDESSLFYGRDQDISNIKLRLRQNRLVALLSASKAGKTSFLRAGVMANFDKNLFNGINGPRWKSVYFTPEHDPVLSMARAIVNPKSFLSEKIKPSMEEEVLRKLEKNDYGLVRVAEDIIGDQAYNLLMVVDDFADLFTRKVNSKRCDQFVNLISKAIKTPNLGFYCIISMNLEDLSLKSLKEYEDLYKSIMKGNYQLRLLDQMGLKDAIEIPAKIEKSEVDEQLSLQLIEELISDADQLRKLQIYMSKTWFEWKKNHKNKIIDVNHFLKATGQRQKVGLQKNRKGSSSGIKIKGEGDSTFNPQTSGNLMTGSIADDYESLDGNQQGVVARILQVLLKRGEYNNVESISKDLDLMAKIVNISSNELIKITNDVPSILSIERKQVVVTNTEAVGEWDKSITFIENEEDAVENYKSIADASILHYIDGIDIDSVYSKEQYEKVKIWYDEYLPSEEWALLYHKQYELAVDFIGKLETMYGPVSAPKKKLKPSGRKAPIKVGKPAMKLTIKKNEEVPVEDSAPELDEVVEVLEEKNIEPSPVTSKKIIFKGKGGEENETVKKKIVIKKK